MRQIKKITNYCSFVLFRFMFGREVIDAITTTLKNETINDRIDNSST